MLRMKVISDDIKLKSFERKVLECYKYCRDNDADYKGKVQSSRIQYPKIL